MELKDLCVGTRHPKSALGPTRLAYEYPFLCYGNHSGELVASSIPHLYRKDPSSQKQLDSKCHGGAFLRDGLLTAIDIPQIRTSLMERINKTSKQALDRVDTHLCGKRNNAGVCSYKSCSCTIRAPKIAMNPKMT